MINIIGDGVAMTGGAIQDIIPRSDIEVATTTDSGVFTMIGHEVPVVGRHAAMYFGQGKFLGCSLLYSIFAHIPNRPQHTSPGVRAFSVRLGFSQGGAPAGNPSNTKSGTG